jgi:hypothetical protein
VNARIMLAVVIVLTGTTVALAESEEGRQACMQDAFKFCSDAIPDRERVFQCLAFHRDVVSAACHTMMAPSPTTEQQAKEQHASETKGTVHRPKTAKHLAMKRPGEKKIATSTKSGAGKVVSAKYASLPAGHSPLKKHARDTNHTKGKAASTQGASNIVARRDGKPLSLLPH